MKIQFHKNFDKSYKKINKQNPLTSKLISKKFSSIQISTIIWTSSFLVCLPMSFLLNERQIIPTIDVHWISMLIFAVAGLLAFYLLVEGYKKVDATIGGLIGLLEVVFGILFGFLFFKEALTADIIIGSLIILIAAMLPNIKKLQPRLTKRAAKTV